MKKKTIIVGVIVPIVAAVIGGIVGQGVGRQNTINKIENAIANVTGDNANITINDIGDFLKEYENIKNRSNELEELNNNYIEQINECSQKIDERDKDIENYKEQLGESPVFDFQNMQLVLDGYEATINTDKSMVIVNGREYFSKDIIENLLGDTQKITLKDNSIYIGKVVADSVPLINQYMVNGENTSIEDTITDSYGNIHSKAICMGSYWEFSKIIYNVNEKYNRLKFHISVRDNANINSSGIIRVDADDINVYASESLTKTIKEFEVDIPLNDCSLVSIIYQGDSRLDCIISDAILYNE